MHAVGGLSVMTSSKRRSLPVCVFFVFFVVVGVSEALPAAVPSADVESASARHRSLLPTDNDGRRSRRRATVDDVRAMFGGIEDADRLRRLTELANQDMTAAVLEYNEMVLSTATGNGSEASACWMRLNYNVTASPGGLTKLFRDQVTHREIISHS